MNLEWRVSFWGASPPWRIRASADAPQEQMTNASTFIHLSERWNDKQLFGHARTPKCDRDLKDTHESDVSIAQGDIKQLSLRQLLRLRVLSLDYEPYRNESSSAHAAFLQSADLALFVAYVIESRDHLSFPDLCVAHCFSWPWLANARVSSHFAINVSLAWRVLTQMWRELCPLPGIFPKLFGVLGTVKAVFFPPTRFV